MRRIAVEARSDWRGKVERLGLLFHTEEGGAYWHEGAYYEITPGEVETLERATREVHAMCLEVVEHIIRWKRYAELRVDPSLAAAIEWVWENETPSVYGRMDFALTPEGPKLLEYNADTPTTLLETAVVQWHWLQEVLPGRDQFNSVWEALVAYWAWCRENSYLLGERVHFAGGSELEDIMTLATLQDTAREAGLLTEMLPIEGIGWDGEKFVDLQERPIRTIFKLYPWEWMLREEFARPLMRSLRETQWIEPIWKTLLSNKAILALLWELFPASPWLLPAYLDGPRTMARWVKKPIFGREGANVTIFGAEGGAFQPGPYGKEGFVWQAYAPLPDFEGARPVLGSWVVDAEPCGLGIRESDGPITGNLARFVPHTIAAE